MRGEYIALIICGIFLIVCIIGLISSINKAIEKNKEAEKQKELELAAINKRRKAEQEAISRYDQALREANNATSQNMSSSGSSDQLSNADNDSYEEIRQLKELLDMGIINQEEYDAKKKQLLNL